MKHLNTKWLITKISELNLDINNNKIFVAFSGGKDSITLLHLLSKIVPKLTAVHINHGLNVNSKAWVEFCRNFAANINVDFKVITINVAKNNETLAREARFKALAELPGLVFLAHHLQDQLETVLYRMFRGTGVLGVSGIKSINDKFIRPMLDVAQQSILDYVKEHDLDYIEDDSNSNLNFPRNYLRHQILPLIQAKWPSAANKVQALAEDAVSMSNYIINNAKKLLLDCLESQNRINIYKLQHLDKYMQSWVLRLWILDFCGQYPEKLQINKIFIEVISANINANPVLRMPQWVIRRYRNYLYIFTVAMYKQHSSKHKIKSGSSNNTVNSRKQKKLFQSQGIPPWERLK